MSELQSQLAWTFHSECDIPADVQDILIKGERAIAALLFII